MPVLIAFVMGALIGSFLNVCILRMPRNESIVLPASHCFACHKVIAWYDNIPIASYFILRGRCRHCGAVFSMRYALVEALTGLLFALTFGYFGLKPVAFVYVFLIAALIVETFIDLDHQIIPDEITLPGIVIGLLLSVLIPGLHGQMFWGWNVFWSFIGVLVGGGVLYLMGTIAEWVLKKEAMGGGDVKLLAMIGSIIGWQGVVWTLFVSSVIGSVVGLYLRAKRGDQLIPYGPYLAAAAVSYIFVGPQCVRWYLGYLGF